MMEGKGGGWQLWMVKVKEEREKGGSAEGEVKDGGGIRRVR